MAQVADIYNNSSRIAITLGLCFLAKVAIVSYRNDSEHTFRIYSIAVVEFRKQCAAEPSKGVI
jgi:hypothetical protein